MADRGVYGALENFREGKDPGVTLEKFQKYLKRAKMVFATAEIDTDPKKKSFLQIWGGEDMMRLFEHVGKVAEADTFDAAMTKIENALKGQINEVYPVYKLFCEMPQGRRTFGEWYPAVYEQAKQCNLAEYTPERAARDAMTMQTDNNQLRKRALAEGPSFENFVKLGIAMESATAQAGKMERTESVSAIQHKERERMYAGKGPGKPPTQLCDFCGYNPKTAHSKGKCPAKGKKCNKCQKRHHFAHAKACPQRVYAVSGSEEEDSESESEEGEVGRVQVINQVDSAKEMENMVEIRFNDIPLEVKVDSGCSKVIIPEKVYKQISKTTRLIKTKVRLRPYGMKDHLEVLGGAKVRLTAQAGASMETWCYVVKGFQTESLLGSEEAKRLGILEIHAKGKPADIQAIRASMKAEDQSKQRKETIQAILDKHDKLFQGIGKFSDQEIRFNVDPTVKPVVQRERPVPLGYRPRLSEHLKELRDNDVIEGPLDSTVPHDWVSNVIITEKKSTGKIRMNVDMRHANIAIRETHFPVPTVRDLRHKLNGATTFSKLDLRHAFHQMVLAPESRGLTTFYTHEGLYRFKRLVMGAGPASQEFHEKLRLGMIGLQGVIQIEDDILVYGATQEENDERLQAVLQRFHDKGITLRKEKCEWSTDSVIWFGYKFSKDGMSPDPAKVETIRSMPKPTNAAEVKSFLQMCQYNSMFMFDTEETYSDTTAPLRALLRKDVKFKWTKRCEESFIQLREGLMSDKVIVPWVQGRPTKVHVDRGPLGVAATVYQQEPDSGYWKTINYTSRALTEAEQGYAAVEGESLAIYQGLRMNRMHLYGIPFKVITDHQPLVSLYNNPRKEGPMRVERHRTKLQGFNFTVEYCPGARNPTDYNSRHPLALSSYTSQDLADMDMDDDEELYINRVIESDLPDAVTMKVMKDYTNKCDVMAKLKYCIIHKGNIHTKDPDLAPYKHVFPELSVMRQLIMRGEKIVVPRALQEDVVALAHSTHQGSTKTKQFLRARVWFPAMDRMVDEYVQSCIPCQAATSGTSVEPVKPTELPEHPWEHLAMDFKGPVGKEFYFLVVVDEYSRYPEVAVVKSTAAEAVLPELDRILSTHGVPQKIKSDNGPPFKSQEMVHHAKQWGYFHQKISPEQPTSNGLAENFMRMVVKLAHTAYIEGKDPKREIYKYLLTYRATPHSTTGIPPAELLFNRPVQTTIPKMPRKHPQHKQLKARDAQKKQEMKQYNDQRRHARNHTIKIGDKVLVSQKKSTTKPPYNPTPMTVTKVKGSMVTATVGRKHITRDASKFKSLPSGRQLHGNIKTTLQANNLQEDAEAYYTWYTPNTDTVDQHQPAVAHPEEQPQNEQGVIPEGEGEERERNIYEEVEQAMQENPAREQRNANIQRERRVSRKPKYLHDYVTDNLGENEGGGVM